MNVTFGLCGQRPSAGLASQEDVEPFFTQPTTSQVQRGLEKVTGAQVDQKVPAGDARVRSGGEVFLIPSQPRLCVSQTAELVQFILVKDQKKIPIRRAGGSLSIWIYFLFFIFF